MGQVINFVVPSDIIAAKEKKLLDSYASSLQKDDVSVLELKEINNLLINIVKNQNKERWAVFTKTIDVYEAYSAIIVGLLLLTTLSFLGHKKKI